MMRQLKQRCLFACVGLLGLLGETNTLSIMSYNIMDSGFADESGKYDPVGDRIPGNLSTFMASQSPFVDVLGLIETGSWSENDTSHHPGYLFHILRLIEVACER